MLREHFHGASWSAVRELITSGKVTVSGARELDPGRPVAAGDWVEVRLTAPRGARGALSPEAVVYLDAELVVVEKPAGVASVPFEAPGEGAHQAPSSAARGDIALSELIADRLFREARREAPRAGAPARSALGVVQRLDRETSGLMVFARTAHSKRHLQQQLRQHSVHRRYLAIAHGDVSDAVYHTRLVQDRGDGRRGSTLNPSLGRESITHVRRRSALAGATLVECRLETGRTHQIRIHLAEAGHPLLGERVYTKPPPPGSGVPWRRSWALEELLPAPRVMLHAAELGFIHPRTGRELRFSSPPPPDFEACLASLR